MNFSHISRPYLVIRGREVIERVPQAFTYDIRTDFTRERGLAIFYDENRTMVKEIPLQPLDIVKPEYIGFGMPDTGWTV